MCSFWNLTSDDWSGLNCSFNRRQSTRNITVCECNHLTSFAALADIRNREEPSTAKSIITIFSSSTTCIFLIAAIFIKIMYNHRKYTLQEDQQKVKANTFRLNLNIIIWLFISHLLIIFGMDRTEVQYICKSSSLLLLYSLLTAFSFSLMLSVHLYLSSSKRHVFCYFNFKNFAMFAYFFPLFIIILFMLYVLVKETNGSVDEMFNSLTGEYL